MHLARQRRGVQKGFLHALILLIICLLVVLIVLLMALAWQHMTKGKPSPGVAASAMAPASRGSASGGAATKSRATADEKRKILDVIAQFDGKVQLYTRDGELVFVTSGITQVREMGPKALPALLELIEDDETKLDLFLRCSSAAIQILKDV